MKRKKFLLKSLVLSVALLIFVALAFVGCGDDETGSSSSTPQTGSSTVDSSSETNSSTEDSSGDAACEHNGGSATCTEKAKCTECGEEYGELLEHDYEAATCTVAKTCKVCQTTDGNPLGHDEVSSTKTPTCTAGGFTSIMCSRCDYTAKKDETAALGHDEKYDAVAPTCVAAGVTNITCSRCDYTATKDPIEATGVHKYDVKGDVVAPTCTTDGYTVYGCSAGACGTTENRDPVAALDHDCTVFVKTVAATCAEWGYDEYKCVRCSETDKISNTDAPTGEHELAYFKTVKPTCSVVGHKLYKCKTCDLTWKNPDLTTPNEPLPEDIVATIDHNYDYATIDGLVACFMCGKGYRDVTVELNKGEDVFCMGCGKEPCECGSTGEWSGYTPAKEPELLTAETTFTKSEVALTSGNVALQIGGGLIVFTSEEAETTYTVVIYASVDGAAVDTVEVSGDYVLLFLDKYESVVKVEITASTDAAVSFYVAE